MKSLQRIADDKIVRNWFLMRVFTHAAPGAAPGNPLDDLLGGSAPSPGSHFLNNTIVAVEAPPGLAQNYASSGQQHSFDSLQGASIGISAQPTVRPLPCTILDLVTARGLGIG